MLHNIDQSIFLFMSNSTLQSDPDALRESAIAVITYVRDAMNEGVALLREHYRLLVEN